MLLLSLFCAFSQTNPSNIGAVERYPGGAERQAVELTTWFHDTPVHLELYGDVKAPTKAQLEDTSTDRLEFKLGATIDQGLSSLTGTLTSTRTCFAPSGVVYSYRPVAAGTTCDVGSPPYPTTTCQSWEVYPVTVDGAPYQSPLDIALPLAVGEVDWVDIEDAFQRTAGRGLVVNGPNRALPPVVFQANEVVTMREYLSRVAEHVGAVWEFRGGELRERGIRSYALSVVPRRDAWLYGQKAKLPSEKLTGLPLVKP